MTVIVFDLQQGQRFDFAVEPGGVEHVELSVPGPQPVVGVGGVEHVELSVPGPQPAVGGL